MNGFKCVRSQAGVRFCRLIWVCVASPSTMRPRKSPASLRPFTTLLCRPIGMGVWPRFATDIADYAEMVGENIATQPAFAARPGLLAERPQDWPQTRYEQKAIAAGRLCQFFVFERV